jgi:dipeptidyl-peptidase III
VLEQNSIHPENTRIRKLQAQPQPDFEVLLASTTLGESGQSLRLPNNLGTAKIIHGDHANELEKICDEFYAASKYAANELQREFIKGYTESFQTGNLEKYRDSQRKWVVDKAPKVENIFGFVEPYRDPHGIRAEFEGLVAISDEAEAKLLESLVENSATFIRRLPWATPDNNGKGHFEKTLFEPPDFSSIHSESKNLKVGS